MVTIGQSPRIDVTSDIKDILGPDIEIIECGALDGLTFDDIKELEPKKREYILVTRMRDGTQVKVSRKKIIQKIQSCIEKIENYVDIIMILCTGDLPGLNSKKLLIKPSVLLYNIVVSLLPKGKLGILIPSPDQVKEAENKWRKSGLELVIKTFPPYVDENVEKIANEFRKEKVDMIVLDCIGYGRKISEVIKKITKKPVFLPRTLLARILRELIE